MSGMSLHLGRTGSAAAPVSVEVAMDGVIPPIAADTEDARRDFVGDHPTPTPKLPPWLETAAAAPCPSIFPAVVRADVCILSLAFCTLSMHLRHAATVLGLFEWVIFTKPYLYMRIHLICFYLTPPQPRLRGLSSPPSWPLHQHVHLQMSPSASLSPSHTPSAPPSTPLLSSSAINGTQARTLDLPNLIASRDTLLLGGDATARDSPIRQHSGPVSASNGHKRGVLMSLLDNHPGGPSLAQENTASQLFMTFDHLPRPSWEWGLPELPSGLHDRTGAGPAIGLGFAGSHNLTRDHSEGTGILHGRILHGLSPDTTGQTTGHLRHVEARSEVEGMEYVQSAAPARDDGDVAMELVGSSPLMPTFPSWRGKAKQTTSILPTAPTSYSFSAIPLTFQDSTYLNPPSPDLVMMDTLSEFPFPQTSNTRSCPLPRPPGSQLSTNPSYPPTFFEPPFSRKRPIESTLTPPTSPSETTGHAPASVGVFASTTTQVDIASPIHRALHKRSRATHDTATESVHVEGFFGEGGDGAAGSGVTGIWGSSPWVNGTSWMSMARNN
ncbi:hypothetical protein M427DRAFT_34783 [Gonapodya prolifera JEL478]|uniref:Uncharacterized protein n=1 Tax=Gonapodya prolifera (strain JEL478) TaxID=1344416 RepID=A0A139A6X0_GONPJ|nr:hypothetical protein M427DRAFT_34783 [Gonapodya prolifera JEL478]|eukprot:KXS12409.1 hypothetical protein M427DRAFT_34783 [Gonapodya prolifera JEL478]